MTHVQYDSELEEGEMPDIQDQQKSQNYFNEQQNLTEGEDSLGEMPSFRFQQKYQQNYPYKQINNNYRNIKKQKGLDGQAYGAKNYEQFNDKENQFNLCKRYFKLILENKHKQNHQGGYQKNQQNQKGYNPNYKGFQGQNPQGQNSHGQKKYQKNDHQGGFSSLFPKKKNSLVDDLSMEEGQILLNLWKAKGFVDLNAWIQRAKCTLKVEFNETMQETSQGDGKMVVSSYTCNLVLTFNKHPDISSFVANGFGKKKRDAKFMAQEKLTVDLIQSRLIKLGLTDKIFISEQRELEKKKMEPENPVDTYKEMQKMMTQKKSAKLIRRMHDALKADQFPEALETLSLIFAIKEPSWDQVSFVWCYAINKMNLTWVTAVIDLLAQKSSKTLYMLTGSQEYIQIINSSTDYVKNVDQQRVRQELLKRHGILRQISGNPYEIYDYEGILVNDQEINFEAIQNISELELESVLLRDPYARNMNDSMAISTEAFEQKEGSITKGNRLSLKHLLENHHNLQSFESVKALSEGDKQKIIKSQMMMDSKTQREIALEIFHQKYIDESKISYEIIENMYDSLLFTGDLKFSLEISEQIYQKLKINHENFCCPQASVYYTNKINMLYTEIYEIIFQNLGKKKQTNSEQLANLHGTIEKIGTRFANEVVILHPAESKQVLENKLIKKCKLDVKDFSQMIAEGDIVILTSFFLPSYDKPFLKDQTSFLAGYINQLAKNTKESNSFISSITEFGNTVEYAMIAQVKEILKDTNVKLYVQPNKEHSVVLENQGRIWKITRLANRYGLERMEEALKDFCIRGNLNTQLFQVLLTPKDKTSPAILGLIEQSEKEVVKINTKTNLNVVQDTSVKKAAYQTLTLVNGPRGSGKTITAVEIVIEWLRQSSNIILVTSELNSSVDIIYGELQKAGIKAVRLGPGFEDQLENLQENAQNNFEQNSNMVRTLQKVPQNMRFVVLKRMIKDSQVVCCTCSSVYSDYLKNINFSRVLIDDAHKISELELLIAISKNCNQLVLIGDHVNPGPKSGGVVSCSKGFSLSIFEKLLSQGVPTNILTTQYRNDRSLVEYPSLYYYNNCIENCNEDDDDIVATGFNWPNKQFKTALINVKGVELLCGGSLLNNKEAEVTVEVIMNMLKQSAIRCSDIGIITTQDSHRIRLRNELAMQAKKYPNMFGLTPEDSQRITRSTQLIEIEHIDKADNGLGSLRDPKRIISVITSAKKGLIIIGDFQTLSSNEYWLEYINWCRANQLILYYCN